MEKCLLAKFFTLCRCEKPKKAYSAPMDGHRVFLDFRIAKKKKKKKQSIAVGCSTILGEKKRPQIATFVQISIIVKRAVAPYYCCKHSFIVAMPCIHAHMYSSLHRYLNRERFKQDYHFCSVFSTSMIASFRPLAHPHRLEIFIK